MQGAGYLTSHVPKPPDIVFADGPELDRAWTYININRITVYYLPQACLLTASLLLLECKELNH